MQQIHPSSIWCQPRSRGLLLVGFRLLRHVVETMDPLPPILPSTPCMVIPLTADVSAHPWEIFGAEADYTVARLPLKHFLFETHPTINFVRCVALQSADELANENRRLDRDREMNVSIDAANLVDYDIAKIDCFFPERSPRQRFDGLAKRWQAEFRVPDQMEIDLAVVILGHARNSRAEAARRKPRKRGCTSTRIVAVK